MGWGFGSDENRLMEFTIFDTSVWIDFSRGKVNSQTLLLEKYLSLSPVSVLLTPTIIQEFLMGLRDLKDFNNYQRHFKRLICLDSNWSKTSVSAAKLYLNLRKQGITIRKSADCLIAQVAIENDLLLVHNDSDFDLIAQGSRLRVY